MSDLVEVQHNEVLVDSHFVARKFGMQHAAFVRSIENVLSDYSDIKGDLESPLISEKYYIESRHYRGTDFSVYLMNREFFSLVAMRLKTKKAREWQRKFNSAFYEMEKRLIQVETNKSDIEWTSTRLIGKSARIAETDAIKEFIEYATEQGSKSANFYYKHITNATYKALGLMVQKHPKIRDQMNIYEISELMLAERLAANNIKKYMAMKRHYKDIYESVKNDLLIFSDSIRINNTVSLDKAA